MYAKYPYKKRKEYTFSGFIVTNVEEDMHKKI